MSHSRYENASQAKDDIDGPFLDYSTNQLLDVLDRYSAKATFFTLGVIAKKMPSLVKRIHDRGHEIASHGFYHKPVYALTPEDFRHDLVDSLTALQDATGQKVYGFRAPYWSVTNRSLWALDIIGECGLAYDSSISPVMSFLYGIKGAPRFMYKHSKGFWEIPPTTCAVLGKLVIVGGGFYLRALPYWFTRQVIRSLNKDRRFGLVYLHPHELVNQRSADVLSVGEYVILNFNKGSFRRKFTGLLGEFTFLPIKKMLDVS